MEIHSLVRGHILSLVFWDGLRQVTAQVKRLLSGFNGAKPIPVTNSNKILTPGPQNMTLLGKKSMNRGNHTEMRP